MKPIRQRGTYIFATTLNTGLILPVASCKYILRLSSHAPSTGMLSSEPLGCLSGDISDIVKTGYRLSPTPALTQGQQDELERPYEDEQ